MKNKLGSLPVVVVAIVVLAALVFVSRSGARRVDDPPALGPAPTASTTTPTALVPERSGAHGPADPLEPAPTPAATSTDGFVVHGVVRARGGQPIDAAEVTLAIAQDGSTRAAGRARTARDGRYSIELAELAATDPLARAGLRVVASASASGRQPQSHARALAPKAADAGDARSIAIDFELSAGRELSGRVVDSSEKPVRGAQVALVVGGRTARTVSAETESAADGTFRIGFVSSGKYELAVRADNVGTALVELDLAAGDDRKIGDVVLRGFTRLAGRVRSPDEQPAPYVELWAIHETVERNASALVETVRRAPLEERNDGLFYGQTTTDAEGRFAFAGLQPGAYAVRSPKPEVVLEPRQAYYSPGTEDIELLLQSYRLIVRVRDVAGRPVTGAKVVCTEMTELEGGELEAGRASHATTRGPDGVASFEVEPDTTLALSAVAVGGRETEDLVVLAQSQYQLVHELVIEPATAPGRLRVVVSGPSGEPVGPLEVTLVSATTQRPLLDLARLTPDAEGWLPPVPPGRYRLDVATLVDERTHWFPVRSREVVDVASGAARELFLTTRVGGRLELALDLAGGLPDDDFDVDTNLDPEQRAARHEERLRTRGAVARLVAADNASATLQFLVPSLEVEGRVEIASRLLPGDRAPVEALFEPGSYTLEVDAPGFRHARIPVVVVAGRTIEVRVPLSAL